MKHLVIIFLLSFVTVDLLGQSNQIMQIPQVNDVTYYSNVNWDEDLSYFENPRKPYWNFKKLRPSYIIKEDFISNPYCNECITYRRSNGITEYYIIENENLRLLHSEERVYFTKSQSIDYFIEGNNYQLPKMGDYRKGLNNKYKKIAKISSLAFSNQLDFLPKNTDSLMIEIEVSESNRIINNGVLELYHLKENATLINTIIRTALNLKIKYQHSEKWFYYKYRTSDLPAQLLKYNSRIPLTQYKYYCNEYVFPVLMYDIVGKGPSNILLQDKINVFNIPEMDYSEKHIACLPDPVSRFANFYLTNFPISNYRLEVTNIVGKIIQKVNFRRRYENNFEVDMLNLPDGLYFYEFIDSKGIKTTKKYLSKIRN